MKLSFLIASAMLLSSAAVWAQPQAGSDMPPPPPPHGGMLQETDADGDGKVSRAEFLSKAEDRFNKADANGDGFITQEEFMQLHQKMMQRMGARGGRPGQPPQAPAGQ